jgi:hypothetical protein
MKYPIYYKKELCCSQAEYLMRTADTRAVFVKTHKGEELQRSVVTHASKEEFDAHLTGFVPVVLADTNEVFKVGSA